MDGWKDGWLCIWTGDSNTGLVHKLHIYKHTILDKALVSIQSCIYKKNNCYWIQTGKLQINYLNEIVNWTVSVILFNVTKVS